MGNNLNVLHKGKLVAALGRKHYFTFYGDNVLPTEQDIEKEVSDSRKHIESTIVGYAAWLAAQDEGTNLTEHMDDIVTSIKDLLDDFEYDVSIAGRNWVLRDLVDQYDEDGPSNDIEVIDDNELYRREQKSEKETASKIKYFENLRNKLDKIDFDEVEHQTSDVDLEVDFDFEKDTLVGEKWEDARLCDDLNDHVNSVEDIGYCRYCRDLEEEEEKCGSIKIGEKVTKGW